MRENLNSNPDIFVKNDRVRKNVILVASNQRKSFLNEKDYKKSVHNASSLIKNTTAVLKKV